MDHSTIQNSMQPDGGATMDQARPIHELDALFKPKSIAIIGASSKELSIGNVIIKNLVHYGYTGAIYPINPKEPEIRGIKAYATVSEVPGNIDLAHIIIPSKFVPGIIEECGKKGIKAVIINSAGFSEMGAEGVALQEAFLAKAKEYGVRVFGPNCQGIINTDPDLKAYCDFTFTFPEPGGISIAALSGGVGAFIMQSLFDLNIGMRMYASNGNACDISIPEVLEYYGEDPGTKAIILYTEGFSDPKSFMDTAARVAHKKPVLAMKAGRTEEGAKAAASHTGSLAGADIGTELIFEKTGILAFRNEEDMCQAAMAFATQPIPKGNRVGIITNTGGPAVIATDELVNAGMVIPALGDRAKKILEETMLPEATISNPIDVVATGGGKHFRSALDVLLEEEGIDSIFINFVTAPFTDTDDVARNIVEVSQLRKKPIVCNFMTNLSLERFQVTAAILRDGGVPCYSFPTAAAKALGAMYKFHKAQVRNIGVPKVFLDTDDKSTANMISEAVSAGKEYLDAAACYYLLSAYGIPVPAWQIADDVTSAVLAADAIGYPVVVKAEAANLVHKSDKGGVAVNLKTSYDVRTAINHMKHSIHEPDLRFLVQKFLPGGKEMIAGISTSPGLGHLMMFGTGGIYVEALKDVIFKILPITQTEATEMVAGLRMAALLDGIRGEKPVDKAKITDILLRLSQLVMDHPQIKEMDLNPILAFEHEAWVADIRIKI